MVYFGKWTGKSFQGPHRSSPVLCSGAMCAPRRYTLLPTQSNDVIKTAHSYLTLIFTWARTAAQPPTGSHRLLFAQWHLPQNSHRFPRAPSTTRSKRPSQASRGQDETLSSSCSSGVLLGRWEQRTSSWSKCPRVTNSITKLNPAMKIAANFKTSSLFCDRQASWLSEKHKMQIWNHSLKCLHP